MNTPQGLMRAVLRGIVFPGIAARAVGGYFFSGAGGSLAGRVAWLQRTSALHARWFGASLRVTGEIPRSGLIVANHISYIDVIALSTAARCAFVSSHDVGEWPLFGAYAKWGATIFVDRARRGAVAGVADDMHAHLDAGIPLVLFAEGMASDGTCVLPFRSSLLEPAVQLACPLTACGIRYEIEDGSVAEDIAFWGDMTLIPHLPKLLTKRRITVELHFGPSRVRGDDRKTLARELREEVCALAGISPDARMREMPPGVSPALTSKVENG